MSDNSADRPGLPITEKTGPSSRPAVTGHQPPPPRIWRSGQPFLHKLPKSGGDHWKECKEKVDQFDKDFYAGWISEVDSLPTFAGLFSAVVTSFTIESYKLLQPDPQDATNQILLNISAQLAGQNVTASVPPPFSPSASSIRINIFWFLSLILSLGAGLLGIVCKQWLQRYKRDISLPSPKHDLALRQLRYDGFVKWGVVDIMGALPLLLELGVVLFFIGLVDFLQGLNMQAAIPVIVVIWTGTAFLIITTILPALQYLIYWVRRRLGRRRWGFYTHPPTFAFRSPPSRVVLRLVAWFLSARDLDWTTCDIDFISYSRTFDIYTARGLEWLDERFSYSSDAVYHICLCMHDIALPGLRQLADEFIHKRWRRSGGAPFVEYASEVLHMPNVGVDVARDIVTGVYLNRRLRTDRHEDVMPIFERRIRVLNASRLPVSSELFNEVFMVRSRTFPLHEELRWQKAMLLRTLLVQERIPHALKVVVKEVANVCTYNEIFSTSDLKSFLDAVYNWIEADAENREKVVQKFFEHAGVVLASAASQRNSIRRFMESIASQGVAEVGT